MTTFKVKGMAEEGRCERCGTVCPRRRVAVVPVYADGSEGEVECWGVNCAAAARYGSKSSARQASIRNEAEAADRLAAMEAADREARFQHRVSGKVDPGLVDNPKGAANARYRATGRPLVGSWLAIDGDGRVVRVDGNDPADVSLFEGRGFAVRVAAPVESWMVPAG